ncbi:hypothetical protein I8752_31060 [Nostocaceae cyanobacterium CENA369]|uniref:Uncharacterized protein n=1 Tax=Dendronalium phyllosphericum CENA369 TaxID=1725256 RepID=A0A8J7I9V1_9NOST|nr:hypothetical protein [Dendronalium phyllosphericum]MBH8577330.1 hypothetical protein [Dendronalium phyllosphericum CENA369]
MRREEEDAGTRGRGDEGDEEDKITNSCTDAINRVFTQHSALSTQHFLGLEMQNSA